MKHVESLSGGRTSTGPLPSALIEKYGHDNVDLVFCDTGAEHEDTYRFIRDAEVELGKKITCLKLVMPKEKGKGCAYKVCTTSEICPDYYAWKQLTSKYGNPYIPGGKFCTDQMKTQIFRKYCEATYGKGNFYTWLGYRYEEGQRIWGRDASNALGKAGLNNREKTEFFLDCLIEDVDMLLGDLFPSMFPSEEDEKQKGKIKKALQTIQDKNYRFMPEVCKFDKGEVIQWWSGKDSDLKIEEHKTNCIFCPEKPLGTLILAAKDCPDEAKEFLSVVESDEVAEITKRNGEKRDNKVMYRDGVTFRWILEKAESITRDEALQMSNLGKKLAKRNPCSSGECNAFGEIHEVQLELKGDQKWTARD
ncbi:rossmann-like alpha/beta/alpha sandwich fold protein [Vibrio phage 1.165.O._10N.261.51.B7]|nr:rossmann-like alpha/beta/alpha sandwich fold protein [Vibrio phage 1.165.O._10N.261.51.B7]